MSTISDSDKIPNNVNLSQVRTLQQALEQWYPNIDKRIAAIAADRDYWREQAIGVRSSCAQGEAVAWMHEDGRVIPAVTKASAERDGGAMRSSLAGYTIPLYASAPAAPAQDVPLTPGWVCAKCGTDRTKAACPKGHSAALTGDCPMVGSYNLS